MAKKRKTYQPAIFKIKASYELDLKIQDGGLGNNLSHKPQE